MSDQHRDKEGQNHSRLDFDGNHPHVQHGGDNSQVRLYTEAHNSAKGQFRQGLDGERAKTLGQFSPNFQKLVSSHKQHIIRLDAPKPCQLRHEKIPLVAPSDEFSWFETSCGWFILYQEGVDTNIQIRSRLPLFGTYILAIADTCIEFSSLADAILVANSIALVFKDSLPAKAISSSIARSEGEDT